MLNQRDVCQQCISSFDWNRDKLGLSVLSGLDQTIRVMIVTKLNLYWQFYKNPSFFYFFIMFFSLQ